MAEMTLPTTPTPAPVRARPSRALLLIGGAILIFVATYVLAWWDAYRLTSDYIQDADRSYEEGRYLDALTGYEAFDQATRKYVPYGGYLQVERIWSNRYAFPVPDAVEKARARIDDIIYTRLTLEDAETFVQRNIGRSNPAMGLIYLRLGELYEEAGELRDAEDIYESIPDLFPNDEELIARARADLEQLRQKLADG